MTKKIIPEIYSEALMFEGHESNFVVIDVEEPKLIHLKAVFEYTPELVKFCKKKDWHIEFVKNKK